MRGRVIVLPALNFPAAEAGRRTSPVDHGNLNRAYPGDPDGGPTAQIAHYMSSVLMPMATAYHDLHSGGSSLEYLEYAGVMLSGDEALDRRSVDLLHAFAPPIGIIRRARDARAAQPNAHRLGVAALGGEFGGRGGLSRHGLAILEIGIRNELKHLGIWPEWEPPTPRPAIKLMTWSGRDGFVYAPAPGIFEPFVELGDRVDRGQPFGRLHFIEDPGRPALELRFQAAGLLVCRRATAHCRRGDCLGHLASVWPG
jgi:predicted deacylase